MMPEPTRGAQSLTFRSWALALLARDERRIRKRKITALLRIVWSVFVRLWISSPSTGEHKGGGVAQSFLHPHPNPSAGSGQALPPSRGKERPGKGDTV